MKRWVVLAVVMMAASAWAAPSELAQQLQQVFPPAEHNRSLVTSQLPLDLSKVRGYAVIQQAGIPAAQAYWFITRQDYEYRPFIIEDHAGRTYFGKVDVTLAPGTVMVVTAVEVQRKTVQIKLLSKDVLAQEGGAPTTHDTRAAVALTFKFPQLGMTAADAPTILSKIEEYIAPMESSAAVAQSAPQKMIGKTPAMAPAAVVPAAAAPAIQTPVPSSPPSHGVVHAGMTMDQVKQIKGEPKRITTHGGTVVYDYGEHDVIFVQGKVHDIRWK